MDTFKELGRALWKDKPVLIVIVAALAFLLYIYWRSNHQAQQQAATGDQTGTPQYFPIAAGTTVERSSYVGPTTITYTGVASTPLTNTPVASSVPAAPPSKVTPIIPYNYFPSHQFPVQPGNPYANVKQFTYGGTTYNINPGAGGRIWGVPLNAQGVPATSGQLLYAPSSYY